MTSWPQGSLDVRDLSVDGSVIEITVNGRLLSKDNEELLPQLEAAIDTHGMIRLLLRLEGFAGVDLRAAMEDIRFDFRHLGELERIAVVGERPREQWITRIGSLFLAGEVRYFDAAELAEAERWILSGGAPGADPVTEIPIAST